MLRPRCGVTQAMMINKHLLLALSSISGLLKGVTSNILYPPKSCGTLILQGDACLFAGVSSSPLSAHLPLQVGQPSTVMLTEVSAGDASVLLFNTG